MFSGVEQGWEILKVHFMRVITKVYHRGYDCVSYNQHPSRWKLRRSGVNEVLFGYSRDFRFQLTNITVVLIYVTHDYKLCIKSKKFTSIFNNKLNKRCFLVSNKVHFMRVITCMKVRIRKEYGKNVQTV
jgi:hypothetical protein